MIIKQSFVKLSTRMERHKPSQPMTMTKIQVKECKLNNLQSVDIDSSISVLRTNLRTSSILQRLIKEPKSRQDHRI